MRHLQPQDTPRRLRRFDTIPELFRRIQEEIDRGGPSLDARYARFTGRPRAFAADPLPMAIDDEYQVATRRLRITERSIVME